MVINVVIGSFLFVGLGKYIVIKELVMMLVLLNLIEVIFVVMVFVLLILLSSFGFVRVVSEFIVVFLFENIVLGSSVLVYGLNKDWYLIVVLFSQV